MKHAKLSDLKEIYGHFQRLKDVFPHVRQDKLRRMIEVGQVICQDGVVVTYHQYKKRTRVGEVDIPAGSIMLHQILNSNQFSGTGRHVFWRFVEEIVKPSGGDLYLSVRGENMVACRFYERQGMRVTGTVAWKNGTISGLVYRLEQGDESAQRQNPCCGEAASANGNVDGGSAKPVEQGENQIDAADHGQAWHDTDGKRVRS